MWVLGRQAHEGGAHAQNVSPHPVSGFLSLPWAGGGWRETEAQKTLGIGGTRQAGPGAAATSLFPAGSPVPFLLSPDNPMPIPVSSLPWKDPGARSAVLHPLQGPSPTVPWGTPWPLLPSSIPWKDVAACPAVPSALEHPIPCPAVPWDTPCPVLLSPVPCCPKSPGEMSVHIPLSPSPGAPVSCSAVPYLWSTLCCPHPLGHPSCPARRQALTTAGSWLPGWSRRSRCPSPHWPCPRAPGALKPQGCHHVPRPLHQPTPIPVPPRQRCCCAGAMPYRSQGTPGSACQRAAWAH